MDLDTNAPVLVASRNELNFVKTITDEKSTVNETNEGWKDPEEEEEGKETFYTAPETLTDTQSDIKEDDIVEDIKEEVKLLPDLDSKIPYEPDFGLVRKHLDEPATLAYGWEEIHKDDVLALYSHKVSSGTRSLNKFTINFKNIKPEVMFHLFKDLDLRHWWENDGKEYVWEKYTDYADVVKLERKLPFPISDRECVCFRYYIDNINHPHLIKKWGMYEKPTPYWCLYIRSVQRDDIPVMKGALRYESIVNGWVVEQHPQFPNNTLATAVIDTDLKGSIPGFIIQKVCAAIPHKIISLITEGYKKLVKANPDVLTKWSV